MILSSFTARALSLLGLGLLLAGCASTPTESTALNCTPSAIESTDRARELATCAFLRISDYCAADGQWREEISRYGDLWEVHSIPSADCRAWRAVLRASDGALVTMEPIPK